MSQTFLHACYRVHNIEASMKFYTEVFDFTVTREVKFPEHGFDLVYLVVPGSDFELELTYNYDAEPYTIGNGFSHLALGVDDLESIHAKCLESGYETTKMMGLPSKELSYFFVTDPDGYRLEVMKNN